ncbi:MAG: hypothetical protein U0T80_00880 [Flavobacteriaceae bacterium]
MARFYSYNLSAGTTARLTSPAITFAGASYKVNLKCVTADMKQIT